MDFTLFVGDYAYSSWSLRGWLLLDAFGIPFDLRHARMRTPHFEALRAEIAPGRLVPALSVGDGVRPPVVVWDTIAIAETVHEYHPQAGLWPKGAIARPTARSLVAEMHSGFTALRGACPMNMRRAYRDFQVTQDVQDDLGRLGTLWAHARARATADGPFLFGEFSAVDAFFAPVTSRIATYDLPMDDQDMAYVAAVLAHPSVRRWRAMGMADTYIQPRTAMGVGYELDLPERANPHDPAIAGEIVGDDRVAANEFCPFTGDDIAPGCKVQVGERVLGLGDAFTRDKVAADPYCWPELSTVLPAQSSAG